MNSVEKNFVNRGLAFKFVADEKKLLLETHLNSNWKITHIQCP
jgi:hypothetical protein